MECEPNVIISLGVHTDTEWSFPQCSIFHVKLCSVIESNFIWEGITVCVIAN